MLGCTKIRLRQLEANPPPVARGYQVVGIVPALRGQSGIVYFVGALVLGVVFLYYSTRFALQRSFVCARQLLFVSILYLPVLFALIALDKK